MRPFILWLNNKHITVASDCGHGRYPMTVIVKEGEYGALRNKIVYREIFSQKIIPRVKRFYKKDIDAAAAAEFLCYEHVFLDFP